MKMKVSSEQKQMAKKLLEQRVETQKKGDMNNMNITLSNDDVAGGIVLKSDDMDTSKGDGGGSGSGSGAGMVKKKKKRTMNELLKDATKDDARNITQGMGLIKSEYDNKEKRDICTLNMNNNNMMTRLLDEQKIKLMSLIAYSIVDRNIDNENKIERVTMCNSSIEDKLMMEFMRILCENKDDIYMTELWLESNKIGNDGMDGLCKLIELNLDCLTVIKLYNNKKDVSTSTCNQMIESLDKNDKIIKFTFEFRLQQQKDKLAKILKRNQEIRRRSRIKK